MPVRMMAIHVVNWDDAIPGFLHPSAGTHWARIFRQQNKLMRMRYAEFLGQKQVATKGLHSKEEHFLKQEEDIDVVMQFLNHSNQIPDGLIGTAEEWLDWPSYNIKKTILPLLCRSNPEDAMTYLTQASAFQGTVGHDYQLIQDILNYQLTGKELYAKFIAHKMQPEYDFNTRMNAFTAWQVVDSVDYKIQVKAAKGAFLAIAQNNRRLRNAGRDFVKTYGLKDEQKKVFQMALDMLVANDQLSTAYQMRIEKMTGFTRSP